MNYVLPSLPYKYNSLEPYFDEKTMEIHHTKHHQSYITKTNMVELDSHLSDLPAEELITKLIQIPLNKRTFLQNNLGGHVNHSLFWKSLKINTQLNGKLKDAIINNFSNILNFQKDFEKIAMDHFGSGWIWLIKNDNKLSIVSTQNQDSPLMGKHITGIDGYPIFGLDVWEHAYYLKYQNDRLSYIKAFWNVINWEEASHRFDNVI